MGFVEDFYHKLGKITTDIKLKKKNDRTGGIKIEI